MLLAGDQLALFGDGAGMGADDDAADAAAFDPDNDLVQAALALDLETDPDGAPVGV